MCPASQKSGLWFISRDKSLPVVRRTFRDSSGVRRGERYPVKKYRHYQNDRPELEKFVARLNGRDLEAEQAQEKAAYRQAHIDEDLLDLYFRDRICLRLPGAKERQTAFHYLKSYGLSFFIVKLGKPDVLEWQRQKDVWKRALLNDPADIHLSENLRLFREGRLVAKKVLLQIVYEMNEFLLFLHEMRPEEVPPIRILPFRKNDPVLKHHEAKRALLGNDNEKYILPQHMTILMNELKRVGPGQAETPNYIYPWWPLIALTYAMGLRRNETLGLTPDFIFTDHVSVQQQLVTYGVNGRANQYGPVKDRDARKVPNWVLTPEELYDLIQTIPTWLMHPDTLTDKFTTLTASLFEQELNGGHYTLKDLRCTFITEMLKTYPLEDVRQAAGHATSATTFKHYIKDARGLGSVKFKPKKK